MKRAKGLLLLIAFVFVIGAAILSRPADASANQPRYVELADGTIINAEEEKVLPQDVASALSLDQGVITLRIQDSGDLFPVNVRVFGLRHGLLDLIREGILVSIDHLPDRISVTISGLDWEANERYYVAAVSAQAVFFADVTEADLGVEKLLRLDDTYFPLQVELPFAATYTPQICLHYQWPGVGTVFGLHVEPGILLPAGTYHLQVYDDQAESYSLLKPDFVLQSAKDVATFQALDVARLTTSVTAPVAASSFGSHQYPTNGQYRSMVLNSWNKLPTGEFTTLISKGSYERFHTQVRLPDSEGTIWEYQVTYTLDLQEDTNLVIDLTQLVTVFDEPPNIMIAGEDYSLLNLVTARDLAGRVCEVYRMNGFLRDYSARALTFYAQSDSTPVTTAIARGSKITIPDSLSGDYNVTFELDTGPVPLSPATGAVSVLGNAPPFSVPISLPDNLALSGDVVVRITAIGLNCPSVVQELTLNESAPSANLVISNASGSLYRIKYEIVSGGPSLVPWGYLGYNNRIGFSVEQAKLVYPGMEASLVIPSTKAAQDPVCFRLFGQQLGAPSVTVSYLEQAYHGTRYRTLMTADLVPDVEPLPDGWLIGFSDLSFEQHSHYQVGISTENALFTHTLTPADIGRQIELAIDPQAFSQLHVTAPFPVAETPGCRLELYRTSAEGVDWHAGGVQAGACVPSGPYALVQLTAGTESSSYCLQQTDTTLESGQSVITFPEEQVARLSIAVPSGVKIIHASVTGRLAGSSVSGNVGSYLDGSATSVYVSKGNYQSLQIALWVNSWGYETNTSGPIAEDRDFGIVSLQATTDLHTNEFETGSVLWADERFAIQDQSGNPWVTWSSKDLNFRVAYGGVALKNAAGQEAYLPFIDGRVVLPDAPGDYSISYRPPDGLPIPVASHPPVAIRLFDFPPSLDVNDDDCLDISDLATLALSYGKRIGDDVLPDLRLDCTGDGVIDLYDLVRMARSMKLVS